MSDVLDRNLRALLTRALPDDAPSVEFRRRVAAAVDARLAARERASHASPPARPSAAPPRPRRSLRLVTVALCVAALALVVTRLGRLDGPSTGDTPGASLAEGGAVARLVPEAAFEGLAGVLARSSGAPAWLEVRTPAEPPVSATLGSITLEAGSHAVLRHDPLRGLTELALGSGAAVVAAEGAATTIVTGLGGAAWPVRALPGPVRAVFEPQALAQHVALGLAPGVPVLSLTALDGQAVVHLQPGEPGRVLDTSPTAVAGGPRRPGAAEPSDPSPRGEPLVSEPARSELQVAVRAKATGAPIPRFRAWSKLEVEIPDVATPEVTEVVDDDGRARFVVPEGRRLTLVIEAEGFAPWRASGLDTGAIGTPLAVELERGVNLVGHVHDAATGAPASGALVLVESSLAHDVLDLYGEDLVPRPFHAVETDAGGRYHITHAPRGDVVLRASLPGYAPTWSSVLATGAHAEGATFEVAPLALAAGGEVIGRVERLDGTPFDGATLIVSTMRLRDSDPTRDAVGTARARVMTFGGARVADDGSYRVGDLPSGAFIVLNLGDVEAGASLPRMQQIFVRPGATTRVDFLAERGLRADPGAASVVAVAGVVYDADGAPRANLDLSLYEVRSGGWRATRTDADGRYSVPDVPSGTWALCQASNGYADQQVLALVEVAPRATPLDFDVRTPRGTLEVTLEGPAGHPVKATRLSLERELAPGTFVFHATLGVAAGTVARVDGLPPGRYRATVSAETLGLGHARPAIFALAEGETLREHWTVPAGGALRVVVREQGSGMPVEAYVTLADAAGDELSLGLDNRTDVDGARRFAGLAEGRYRASAKTFDGRRVAGETRVARDTTAELELWVAPR